MAEPQAGAPARGAGSRPEVRRQHRPDRETHGLHVLAGRAERLPKTSVCRMETYGRAAAQAPAGDRPSRLRTAAPQPPGPREHPGLSCESRDGRDGRASAQLLLACMAGRAAGKRVRAFLRTLRESGWLPPSAPMALRLASKTEPGSASGGARNQDGKHAGSGAAGVCRNGGTPAIMPVATARSPSGNEAPRSVRIARIAPVRNRLAHCGERRGSWRARCLAAVARCPGRHPLAPAVAAPHTECTSDRDRPFGPGLRGNARFWLPRVGRDWLRGHHEDVPQRANSAGRVSNAVRTIPDGGAAAAGSNRLLFGRA
jgi:hypothetical protein